MSDLVKRLRHESNFEYGSASLHLKAADEIDRLEHDVERYMKIATEEIEEQIRLREQLVKVETENWQLKQACGYPIPADKETPQNPFKCGICDARNLAQTDD